jgi:hypothetical protein
MVTHSVTSMHFRGRDGNFEDEEKTEMRRPLRDRRKLWHGRGRGQPLGGVHRSTISERPRRRSSFSVHSLDNRQRLRPSEACLKGLVSDARRSPGSSITAS